MPVRRKPGEVLEVDWAGAMLIIMDSAAGEEIECNLLLKWFFLTFDEGNLRELVY